MTVILFVKTVLTPPGRLKDTDEAAERVHTGPVEDLVPLNAPELFFFKLKKLLHTESRKKEGESWCLCLNVTSPAISTGGTCCSTCCRGSLRRAPCSGSRGSVWKTHNTTAVSFTLNSASSLRDLRSFKSFKSTI